MRQLRVGLLVACAAATVGIQVPARMQAQDALRIGSSTPTHVGIVVPDMDEAIRQYVKVMGFAAPKPPVASPRDMPSGQKTDIKLASFYMPNFQIDLIQPVGKVGPYYDHLQKYGMSIQHLGFNVTGDVDTMRAALEQKGGIWALGLKGNIFTYVDFQSTLGTTIELLNRPGGTRTDTPAPPVAAPGALLPPIGSLRVTHVGFAVTDTDAVARRFADVLGIQPPRVIDYKDSQYPPGSTWNKDAYLRLASWKQGDLGLELIESVGAPTPWSEYVKKAQGPAAHHLAIDVSDKMDETIRDLQMKGGKWTNGKAGGNYAYLDFTDTLGLVLELNGTSKSAGVSK